MTEQGPAGALRLSLLPDRSLGISRTGCLAFSVFVCLPTASYGGESLFCAESDSARFWKQTISCGGPCLTHRCGRLFSGSASSSAFAIHSVVDLLVQPRLLTSFLFGTHTERARPSTLTLFVKSGLNLVYSAFCRKRVDLSTLAYLPPSIPLISYNAI